MRVLPRDTRVTGAILATALVFLGGLVVTLIPRETTPAAASMAADTLPT